MEVKITEPPLTTQFLTTLTFLILISQLHQISCSTPQDNNSTSFIIKSCKTTTYPSLCIKTLIPYASAVKANPLKLCTAALKAAIQGTKNCSAAVSKLSKQKGISQREAGTIKECIGDLKDAVSELKQTATAMSHLRGDDRELQWANAKTYGSAAITDADTCVDDVLEEKVNPAVKKMIRSCVAGVEKLMSNALALINHLY
ncbi:hypothetical protein CASFOL_006841 [Castilleja foliolosa]|uniref:Pectinesterase inhibitor domain-containing protein n=1 Tax=Castilleja foliolosa TaxID=1961234 RepID=A0ABD3E7J7_9LAMI